MESRLFVYHHNRTLIQLAASLGSDTCPCNVSCTNWMWCCIRIKLVGHGYMGCLNSLPELKLVTLERLSCALTDIPEHKRAALMYVQRIPPTHTALAACQECCLPCMQGSRIWGQTLVSQHVLPSRVGQDWWWIIWSTLDTHPRPTRVGHARKGILAVASALPSAKRLHALQCCFSMAIRV